MRRDSEQRGSCLERTRKVARSRIIPRLVDQAAVRRRSEITCADGRNSECLNLTDATIFNTGECNGVSSYGPTAGRRRPAGSHSASPSRQASRHRSHAADRRNPHRRETVGMLATTNHRSVDSVATRQRMRVTRRADFQAGRFHEQHEFTGRVVRLVGSVDDHAGAEWKIHSPNVAMSGVTASGMQNAGSRLVTGVVFGCQ
jgi:hypothetical protein